PSSGRRRPLLPCPDTLRRTLPLSYPRSRAPALPSFPTRRSSDLRLVPTTATRNKGFGSLLAARLSAFSCGSKWPDAIQSPAAARSEEHTSELQSHLNLVCRLLLEKKKRRSNESARVGRHAAAAAV